MTVPISRLPYTAQVFDVLGVDDLGAGDDSPEVVLPKALAWTRSRSAVGDSYQGGARRWARPTSRSLGTKEVYTLAAGKVSAWAPQPGQSCRRRCCAGAGDESGPVETESRTGPAAIRAG